MYKIFATIIQRRISDGLDKHLQKTQLGFRKEKSTQDAIYLIRRTAVYGSRTENKLIMVLLDWEKTFGKVGHTKLIEALEIFDIHDHILKTLKGGYRKTTCFTKDEFEQPGKKNKIQG